MLIKTLIFLFFFQSAVIASPSNQEIQQLPWKKGPNVTLLSDEKVEQWVTPAWFSA